MGEARSIAIGSKQVIVGRTDLIGGGLIAAALVIGLMHMLVRSEPAPELVELVEIAETVESARLPRPRPEEPLVTGSITPLPGDRKPRRRVESAKADRSLERAFSMAEDLKGRAFLIASSSAECDQVVNMEVLQSGGSEAQMAVSIECGSGARFHLDRDAILTNRVGSP